MMKSIEDILFESEKKSFQKAAEKARKFQTDLVFWERGKLVRRRPTLTDLTGAIIKEVDIENHAS